MESAVSFAPLRPAEFVNFAGRGLLFAGRGGARPAFRGAGQPVFLQGGATIPGQLNIYICIGYILSTFGGY